MGSRAAIGLHRHPTLITPHLIFISPRIGIDKQILFVLLRFTDHTSDCNTLQLQRSKIAEALVSVDSVYRVTKQRIFDDVGLPLWLSIY